MTPLLKSPRIQFALATGICSLLLTTAMAQSQEAKPAPIKEAPPAITSTSSSNAATTTTASAEPEQARALLDQVKKSEQDRQIAEKQTEMERVKEDQAKAEKNSEALKQTMESTTGLINERTEHLGSLTSESKRLQHELAVAEARITAERIKIEGLRALADAQGKSLSALDRHAEEAKAQARVQTLELEMLQAGKLVPGVGREDLAHAELMKARKALSAAEAKTQAEERIAYDAMKAANAKMTQAESKASYAQKLADNEITPDSAVTKPKPQVAKVAEKKDPDANIPKAIIVDPENLPAIAVGPKTSTNNNKPATKPASAAANKPAPKGTPRPAAR